MKEHMERPEPMEPMEKLPMAEEDVQSAHPYTPEFKAQFEKLLEIARRAQEKGRPAMNMPAPEKEGAEETE